MGLKDIFRRSVLLGATIATVNVGVIDNKTETDV